MHEDARKLRASAVEGNPPFPEETPGMDHAAPVAQPAHPLNPDGRTGDGRQTAADGPQGASESRIVKREAHIPGYAFGPPMRRPAYGTAVVMEGR